MKNLTLFVGSDNYTYTDSRTLIVADDDFSGGSKFTIIFCPSAHDLDGKSIDLIGDYITKTTLDEYCKRLCLSPDERASIVARLRFLQPLYDTESNKPWANIPELIKQSKRLLSHYGYDTASSALNEIIRTENENKGWIDTMLSNHPDYVPNKHYIATKRKFSRNINTDDVRRFDTWFRNKLRDAYVEKYGVESKTISPISREIAEELYYKNRAIVNAMNEFPDVLLATYDGNAYSYYRAEMQEYKGIISLFDGYSRIGDKWLVESKCAELDTLSNIISNVLFTYSQKIDDENTVGQINVFFEGKMKHGNKTNFAAVGQKTTRIMGKIAKEYGIDKIVDMKKTAWYDENGVYHEKEKDMGWNKQYAVLCDALNPLETERWCIVSVNPIDYWTMSFGHKWASCHTIDKNGIRESDGHTYGGCYSSGTESYMLDSSTVIMYLIDGDYNGTDYELEDKLKRCNFHIGEDKIVQGRVYPDGRDGGDEDDIAKEMRKIMQEIVAECCGVKNAWTLRRGIEACYDTISEASGKTNYSDYFYYNDCNVSTLKGKTNTKKIFVGHAPICPCCGNTHDNCKNILCPPCSEEIICEECGFECENDYAEINGSYYCLDCVTWCKYHQEFEVNSESDFEYISGYGYVCLNALENSGDYGYDAWNGEWFDLRYENPVYTYDGNVYRNEENAIDAGYYFNEETYEWERREA